MQPLSDVPPIETPVHGPQGRLQRPSATWSQRLLRVDGTFLIIAGLVQLLSEAVSHYAGKGLHDDTFADSPYTIGFVEAHGLAAMTGILLLWAATQQRRRFFHGFAVATHVFLAAANVIFWDSFVDFNFVAAGILATTAHMTFIACQAACVASLGRESVSNLLAEPNYDVMLAWDPDPSVERGSW